MPAKLLPNQTALIDNIRDLVRTGYGALVTFQAPDAPWLEIAGPNGVQPGGHLFGASVPTVRLRRNGDAAPLAEAAANNDFSGGLEQARRVREATRRRRVSSPSRPARCRSRGERGEAPPGPEGERARRRHWGAPTRPRRHARPPVGLHHGGNAPSWPHARPTRRPGLFARPRWLRRVADLREIPCVAGSGRSPGHTRR